MQAGPPPLPFTPAGLVPAIHATFPLGIDAEWITGTSPAMTVGCGPIARDRPPPGDGAPSAQSLPYPHVIAGLVPAIHATVQLGNDAAWITGTSPVMTVECGPIARGRLPLGHGALSAQLMPSLHVIAGLDPAIHATVQFGIEAEWITGTSPVMTVSHSR